MKLQLPSTIEKISTRADGSIVINIATQELSGENASTLFELKGKFGWTLFALRELTEQDIPEVDPEFKNDKSPSQRLRSVLYILWEQEYKSKYTFEDFYKSRMELLITQIKEKLI